MTEDALFAAARDLADPADRAAFLAAHIPDPAARRRFEERLAAHDAGTTLAHTPDDPHATHTQAHVPTDPDATHSRAPFDPDATAAPHAGDWRADEALAFLKPPARAGSLGRLAHYEVLEVLGSGGFGTVLKAFDDRLHRVVAVKVLAPQLAASGAARARFERESRSAAAVRDEHVVNVFAVSDPGDRVPFLVMEFVSGQTLQQKLEKSGPMPAKEVLRIGAQIARGLAAAHKQGLIHRDIKPANILLEDGVERVKVTDFGLARAAADASISQSGAVAGTPMYMSPEQARGDVLDTRSDLFSLGSVLYALSTGRPPFRAESTLAVLKRVIEDEPRPICDVNREVPGWLADVVAKLHAKNPADRFQTAQEVADLLAGYLAELQQQGMVTAKPGLAPRPRPTRRRWAAAALLLAVVGVGLVWWNGLVTGVVAPQREPAVVTLRLSDPAIQYRWDEDGPPRTGVNVARRPLDPGEHWVWFQFGNRQYRTARFTVAPGEQPNVEIVLSADGARATLDSLPLVVTVVSSPGVRSVAWGEVVDPLGDCRFNEDAGALTITVPPGNHDLNTRAGANTNGPRVLREVTGDFVARVVVQPIPKPLAGTSSRADGVSYVGAGLVVWQDDGNLFRLLRAGLATNNNGAPFAQAEWFPPNADRGHSAAYIADAPIHLRVRRVGGTLHPAYSPDGQTWTELPAVTDLPLGARLRVGVGAVSTYHQEVAFRLERLAVEPAAPPAPTDGFVPLFNGKDLTGWKTHPDQLSRWTVEGGELVGSGKTRSYLFTEREDFADFHLRVEVKTTGQAGLYLRSGLVPSPGVIPAGYRVSVGGGTGDITRPVLGGIPVFEVRPQVGPATLAADRWVTLECVARGGQVKVIFDGNPVANYTDDQVAYSTGRIGLEAYEPGAIVTVRKVEIKEFPAAKAPSVAPGPPVSLGAPKVLMKAGESQLYGKEMKGLVVRTDGKGFFTAGIDGKLLAWDDAKPRPLLATPPPLFDVTLSPDGAVVAAGGIEGGVRFYDLSANRELPRAPALGGPVLSVAFSPDRRTLAYATGLNTIFLWDWKENKLAGTLPAPGQPAPHAGGTRFARYLDDGRMLVSGCFSGTMVVWDVPSRELKKRVGAHGGPACAGAAAPDGSRFYTCGEKDGRLVAWDAKTWEKAWESRGTPWADVAVSADGTRVAAGGIAVRVCDAATGAVLAESAPDPANYVQRLAFSSDGKTLTTVGTRVAVWDLSTVPAAAAPKAAPVVVAPLRELVAVREKALGVVRTRQKAGVSAEFDVLGAEFDLAEARARLAEAEGDRVAEADRLREMFALAWRRRGLAAQRVAAGVDPPDATVRADTTIAEVRVRLARAGVPEPPPPAPLPRAKE